jgi:uncharacterized lipoprotein YmbA
MRKLPGLVTVATLGFGAACFTLGPQTDPSRFYHLRALSEATPFPTGVATVGVGVVTVPRYLDGLHVVERVGDAEVRPLATEYWAEPLSDQIQHVLAEELRAQLGLTRVVRYPWRASDRPAKRVDVDILRFEPDSTGAVALHARWAIIDTTDETRAVVAGEDTWRDQASGPDMALRVDALSRALNAFACDIAARLR